MSDLWALVLFILGFILAFLILMASIMWLRNHAGLPAQLADIEQLRADSAHVDPQQAEDVIGQVTEWNRKIREYQASNDTWYMGFAIPDEWDSVELIPVPR